MYISMSIHSSEGGTENDEELKENVGWRNDHHGRRGAMEEN